MAVVPFLAETGSFLRRTFGERETARGAFNPGASRLDHYADWRFDTLDHNRDRRQRNWRREERLPARYRTVYNPTPQVIAFYAGRLYPGAWNLDGRANPDGTPNRLPFAADAFAERTTVPEGALPAAAMQLLDWSGRGGTFIDEFAHDLAMLGSLLIQVVEDERDPETGEEGKVRIEIVDPRDLTELELSPAGNVRRFGYEFRAWDAERDREFLYRRVVDRDGIEEWRDREQTRADEHPYPFCPGTWARCLHVGDLHGMPVIGDAVARVIEYNRIAAPTSDWVAKFIDQPLLFITPADFKNTPDIVFSAPSGDDDAGPGQSKDYMRLPVGSDVKPLMGQLPVSEVGGLLDRIKDEVEAEIPETVFSREMRKMQNVTGPGADRLMSDVAARFYAVQANADAALGVAIQQGVAIAGHRATTGGFGARSGMTRQQQKFVDYGFDSWARGDLDFSLNRRPLVEADEAERVALAKQKEGITTPAGLREVGYTDEDLYGEVGAPEPRPGILAERDEVALGASDSFTRAINRGLT